MPWWERLRSRVARRRNASPFNCAAQDTTTWLQRADVAAELLARLDPPPRSIADVGCGDEKLKIALLRRGVSARYQGFDVLPQGESVRPFDIRSEMLDEHFDAAAILGVLEYMDDVASALRNALGRTTSAVVSYAVHSAGVSSREKRIRMGWRSALTAGEFETCLDDVGLRVIERRITPDRATHVWLCRVRELAPSNFGST